MKYNFFLLSFIKVRLFSIKSTKILPCKQPKIKYFFFDSLKFVTVIVCLQISQGHLVINSKWGSIILPDRTSRGGGGGETIVGANVSGKKSRCNIPDLGATDLMFLNFGSISFENDNIQLKFVLAT